MNCHGDNTTLMTMMNNSKIFVLQQLVQRHCNANYSGRSARTVVAVIDRSDDDDDNDDGDEDKCIRCSSSVRCSVNLHRDGPRLIERFTHSPFAWHSIAPRLPSRAQSPTLATCRPWLSCVVTIHPSLHWILGQVGLRYDAAAARSDRHEREVDCLAVS